MTSFRQICIQAVATHIPGAMLSPVSAQRWQLPKGFLTAPRSGFITNHVYVHDISEKVIVPDPAQPSVRKGRRYLFQNIFQKSLLGPDRGGQAWGVSGPQGCSAAILSSWRSRVRMRDHCCSLGLWRARRVSSSAQSFLRRAPSA